MTSSTLQGGSHKVDFGFLGIRLKSVENDEFPKKFQNRPIRKNMRSKLPIRTFNTNFTQNYHPNNIKSAYRQFASYFFPDRPILEFFLEVHHFRRFSNVYQEIQNRPYESLPAVLMTWQCLITTRIFS